MPVTIDGTTGITSPDVSATTLTLPAGSNVQRMLLSTAQNTTSGTAIDFTGIPSWAKKITVMFNGTSVNGSSNQLIQLGTGSTTYTTSGYGSVSISLSSTNVNTSYSTGFGVRSATAAYLIVGAVVLTNLSGNTWVAHGVLNTSTAAEAFTVSGSIALSAALTAVRLTTVGGTDTFDAGSVNILVEGY